MTWTNSVACRIASKVPVSSHAVGRRVRDVVGEHVPSGEVVVGLERRPQPGAVEDVVAEDERHRIGTDEVRSDDERLGQALRPWLHGVGDRYPLSLIHISEPTRRTPISYAVFCLKKKKN